MKKSKKCDHKKCKKAAVIGLSIIIAIIALLIGKMFITGDSLTGMMKMNKATKTVESTEKAGDDKIFIFDKKETEGINRASDDAAGLDTSEDTSKETGDDMIFIFDKKETEEVHHPGDTDIEIDDIFLETEDKNLNTKEGTKNGIYIGL